MTGARLYLVSLCVMIALLICPPRAIADDVVITGVVNSGGEPLADATIVASTAAPRTGPAVYCPGCYQDCGTSTVSDENGTFRLKLIDPKLVWRLLVVREGYVPQFVMNVDPGVTTPTVELVPRNWAKIPDGRVVQGVVKDTSGEPIEGATVEPEMVMFADGTGQGGAVDGLDPLSVTNGKGEFRLAYQGDGGMVATMDVTVNAKGHARDCVYGLKPTKEPHVIVLSRGVTVTGHLMMNGEPVGGADVGICLADKIGFHCFGHDQIATFEDGRFLFSNVPAIGEHVVYGLYESIGKLGVTKPKRFMVEEEGAIIDVGNLEIVQGRRVQGRVVLSDGTPIPKGAKINIAQDLAWDSVMADLPPSGEFDLRSVLDGDSSLNVPAVEGYEMSPQNRSYVPVDTSRLDGRIDGDIKNLTVLMIPAGTGPKRKNDEVVQPIDTPLVGTTGYEGAPEPSPIVNPTGTLRLRAVAEREDGTVEPIAGAKVRVKDKAWQVFAFAIGKDDAGAEKSALTDAQGECVLEGMEKGLRISVQCSKEGFENSSTISIMVVDGDVTHQMKLARPVPSEDRGQIAVRVEDEKGRPVEGAGILGVVQHRVSRTEASSAARPASKPATPVRRTTEARVTDKDGRAWLEMAEGIDALEFRVEKPGFATNFVRHAQPGLTTVRMTSGASVIGRVQLEDAKPIAGALVRLVVDASGPWDPERPAGLSMMRVLGTARADAEGRFEIKDLPISVRGIVYVARDSVPAGFASGRVSLKTPAAGESVDVGIIKPERGLRLGGQVTFEEGATWPGEAMIGLLDDDTRELVRVGVLADGRFQFPVVAKRARIHVMPEVGYKQRIDSDAPGTDGNGAIVGRLDEGLPSLAVPVVKRRAESVGGWGQIRFKPLHGIEK